MDWIEGKDLGAILREELAKRTPDGEDPYQNKMWDDPNCTELIHILEKRGFVLPETIVTQLKNTVDLVHKNKLSHGDLHPGNVIIKDGSLDDPHVYIIDWADAVHTTRSIEETEGEYFLSDEKIIKSLTPLTKTPENKRKARNEAMIREWNDRITSLDRQPKAQQQYKSLKAALEGNKPNILEGQFIGSLASDSDLENFLGNLLKLARESESDRDQIIDFINGQMNDKKSKIRSFALNRMQALKNAIEI
jgi:serine/threonine protein kinase